MTPQPENRGPAPLGGVIHTYQRYDPKNFPSPTAPPPDLASLGFEHMLRYGTMRNLTPEQLAQAVKLDISQIAGLGPSLDALIQMLEERKRKILSTYETEKVQKTAADSYHDAAEQTQPPKEFKDAFRKAAAAEQITDLERLWYKSGDDSGPFGRGLLNMIERLGEKYQVEELAAKYEFTGRTPLTVPQALQVKEELEAIDRLLDQLREAMKNAQVALIDMEELAQFASEADVENLQRMAEQIGEYLREQAELQGLEETAAGYRLTPEAYRIFQGKLLQEIFNTLEAARSGRHEGPIIGEGAVEMQSTKPYEFGDSVANMDVTQSVLNAMAREAVTKSRSDAVTKLPEPTAPGPSHSVASSLSHFVTSSPHSVTASLRHSVTFSPSDLEIHRTKNNPKCATSVLMDMSGSMRHDGQYMNAKRMALALDGLIRREYPGDFLSFIEVFTFAKNRHISEVPGLMPKPVTTHSPIVRLKADMSKDTISEMQIPPHFTNIQHGLQLARQQLAVQDTPNRQIVLITDGLPTAHFEGQHLYLLYPPDPLTERATMREAMLCKREGITINIFLLPSWSQSSEDVAFAHRVAEATQGRVFFTGGRDLDRYVLWDYVKQRRRIIA